MMPELVNNIVIRLQDIVEAHLMGKRELVALKGISLNIEEVDTRV